MRHFSLKSFWDSSGRGRKLAETNSTDWFFDCYASQRVWLKRFQLAFWIQTAFCGFLILGILILLPLQKWIPVLVRQNSTTGEAFVSIPSQVPQPDQSEAESDLVDYIMSRESYSFPDAYARASHVLARTDERLSEEYRQDHSSHNPHSWMNKLGESGVRQVIVESVIFLPTDASHLPLAKIDFMTVTKHNGKREKAFWVATVGWRYLGSPQDKSLLWENWHGFSVNFYKVDQRHSIEREESDA